MTVADLLARNSRGACPPDAADVDQRHVPELPRREGRAAEEQAAAVRPTRTCPGAAAAVGLVLVGGVVVASAAALSGPRIDRTAPDVVVQPIAGPDVVRPDVIAAALRSGAPPPARRVTARGEGVPAPMPEQDSVRDPVLSTVATFYQTASTAPADAFALLGEGMRGPGYESFEAAWAGVDAVRVDAVTEVGPQAVLVRVTLAQSDGGALRAVVRVVVGPAPDRRIEDATLLSATTR